MTDNEIIKALECCANDGCQNCTFDGCTGMLLDEGVVLDLINRQKAEIERLRKSNEEMFVTISKQDAQIKQKDTEVDILIWKNETLKDEVSELRAEVERLREANKSFSCLGKLYSEIKSEARKEFAERAKEHAIYIPPQEDKFGIDVVFVEDIDNLLEEMESEGK